MSTIYNTLPTNTMYRVISEKEYEDLNIISKKLSRTRVEVNIIKGYSSEKNYRFTRSKDCSRSEEVRIKFFSNKRRYSLVGRGKCVENRACIYAYFTSICSL